MVKERLSVFIVWVKFIFFHLLLLEMYVDFVGKFVCWQLGLNVKEAKWFFEKYKGSREM